MKSKGFTLVETICVLAILMIIFSLGLSGVNYYRRINADIKVGTSLYELENIMTLGKGYCQKEEVRGRIILKKIDNVFYVYLKCDDGFERDINLGYDLEVYSDALEELNYYYKEFKISSKGHLEAGTIKLKDSIGRKYKITIRVGVDLILVNQE